MPAFQQPSAGSILKHQALLKECSIKTEFRFTLIRHRQCLFFPTWGLFPYNMDTPSSPSIPKCSRTPTWDHSQERNAPSAFPLVWTATSQALLCRLQTPALQPRVPRGLQRPTWCMWDHSGKEARGETRGGLRCSSRGGCRPQGGRKLPLPQEAATSKCCDVQSERVTEQLSSLPLHPFGKGSGS